MNGLAKLGARAIPWVYGCAVLAVVLALSGCGGVATVGSTVVSGAEAVGTLVKKSVRDEEKKKDEAAARPE